MPETPSHLEILVELKQQVLCPDPTGTVRDVAQRDFERYVREHDIDPSVVGHATITAIQNNKEGF